MRLALDLSCLIPQPITGVGYYTFHLFQAYRRLFTQSQLRAVAISAQPTPALLTEIERDICPVLRLRLPTRLHHAMWRRANWPPIEYFTGPADIAHGAFHLVPPVQNARACITVYDLANLRRANLNRSGKEQEQRKLLLHAVKRGATLIAISESTRRDAIELLGATTGQTQVVYGGINLTEFESELSEERFGKLLTLYGIRSPYLIHLGTLEPRKNLPRLIEAYARIRDQRRDCPQLVVTGAKGWMCETVFNKIAELGLRESVIHTGYLSREDAVALLRGAQACLYPSLYEGFGLPVLEAMAARVPVLTSNVSSMPEVAGDTALLVNPEDVDEIAAGITRLLDEPDWAKAQAERGYARARSFTWLESARALQRVYEAMLNE